MVSSKPTFFYRDNRLNNELLQLVFDPIHSALNYCWISRVYFIYTAGASLMLFSSIKTQKSKNSYFPAAGSNVCWNLVAHVEKYKIKTVLLTHLIDISACKICGTNTSSNDHKMALIYC